MGLKNLYAKVICLLRYFVLTLMFLGFSICYPAALFAAVSEAETHNAKSLEELEEEAAPFYGLRVNKILLIGSSRISQRFLYGQLLFKEGYTLAKNEITQSVQNLRNTKIIKSIDVQYAKEDVNSINVFVFIDELWTTIPFVLFSSGGGSVLAVAGIVDSNLFGFGSTGWITYQYLDGLNTWTGKISYPNLLGWGYDFQAEFWKEQKNNEVRKFNSETSLLAGYTSYQESYSLLVKRPFYASSELLPKIKSGLGVRFSNWFFNDEKLSSEAKEQNGKQGFSIPQGTRRIYFVSESDIGSVDFNGNFANGMSLTYRYTFGSPLQSTAGRFIEHFFHGRFFKTLSNQYLFASRMEWQYRISDFLADEDMMGGLFHVRGLPNDVFRGLSLWFYNAELRKFVYKHRYAHLQGVLFQDAGNTARTRTHEMEKGNNYRPKGIIAGVDGGIAASLGAGFRVLFPDISELALRLDYGWLVSPFRTSGLSLGVVQFVR